MALLAWLVGVTNDQIAYVTPGCLLRVVTACSSCFTDDVDIHSRVSDAENKTY